VIANLSLQTPSQNQYGYGVAFAQEPKSNAAGMYVTIPAANRVFVIRNDLTLLRNYSTVIGPWGIGYDPANTLIYVADSYQRSYSAISIINGTQDESNIIMQSADSPWSIAYDYSNGYMYATNHLSGSVSLVTSGIMIGVGFSSYP
jgi:DNA-binding beta-propeller fold protein YncE